MVYVATRNEAATANWAHFAPMPLSLRGEPIITFLLQSWAKITKVPPPSPEHGQGAMRKMSSLQFPIQLDLQTLAEITHPLHSLPANDSPSLRDREEGGKKVREQWFRGKGCIDGKTMGRPIITEDDGCIPGASDFQTGTLNIGDTDISDMAGYFMSSVGGGLSRAPGTESRTGPTPTMTFSWSGKHSEQVLGLMFRIGEHFYV